MIKLQYIIFTSITIFALACTPKRADVPKPRAYPRVERADSLVQHAINNLSFSYSSEAVMKKLGGENPNQTWFNLEYASYNAVLYCSLLSIKESDLEKVFVDHERFVRSNILPNSRVQKSDYRGVDEQEEGALYYFDGNAISPFQFYITDKRSYFLRGSLFYNQEVQTDSIAATTLSLKEDIVKLMETIKKTR